MGLALEKFAKSNEDERKGATGGNIAATAAGALGVGIHNSARKAYNKPEMASEVINAYKQSGVSADKGKKIFGKVKTVNKAMLAGAGLVTAAGVANMFKKKEKGNN